MDSIHLGFIENEWMVPALALVLLLVSLTHWWLSKNHPKFLHCVYNAMIFVFLGLSVLFFVFCIGICVTFRNDFPRIVMLFVAGSASFIVSVDVYISQVFSRNLQTVAVRKSSARPRFRPNRRTKYDSDEKIAAPPVNDLDPFEILDVSPQATEEEITRAYRNMVKTWHPDRFFYNRRMQRKAEEKMKQINNAYEKIRALRAA